MSAPSDLRTQLRSLSISKEQRPTQSPRVVKVQNGRRASLTWWVTGLLVVGIAIAVYLSRGQIEKYTPIQMTSAPEIKLAPVTVRQPSDLPPLLTATGKIVSDHQVQVATKVSGQIVELLFEQGDRVKKGQVLARIEDILYRARRDQAAGELERAKATYAFQQINYERMSRLHETQNAPDIEWADVIRQRDEAKAAVEAAKAALDWAEKALFDCEVLAPIAGVILTRNVEVGDFVAAEGGRGMQANAEFGNIADMNTLRVEVDISELDINRIRKDLPCTVIPDAYKDRRYKGHVMWLDPGANYSKATVQVKVRIENPDEYLRVEGSAQVIFHSELPPTASAGSAPTIWVPSAACLLDADGQTGKVFVASGGHLRKIQIAIGKRTSSEIEARSGLVAGQVVAVENVDHLVDGQRVKGGPVSAQ
ncbi:MAG TPA: efflux RND transporter periplasmic adaptor subunit [Phycisphaerae bacterium]|nr:efflux RND transporter periplasmic adaptor subunit [Phycisphaerae bacterium]